MEPPADVVEVAVSSSEAQARAAGQTAFRQLYCMLRDFQVPSRPCLASSGFRSMVWGLGLFLAVEAQLRCLGPVPIPS